MPMRIAAPKNINNSFQFCTKSFMAEVTGFEPVWVLPRVPFQGSTISRSVKPPYTHGGRVSNRNPTFRSIRFRGGSVTLNGYPSKNSWRKAEYSKSTPLGAIWLATSSVTLNGSPSIRSQNLRHEELHLHGYHPSSQGYVVLHFSFRCDCRVQTFATSLLESMVGIEPT